MRKPLSLLVIAALVAAGVSAPAAAQRGRGGDQREDQASARQEMLAGRTMSSREIVRRVVPQMKGHDYLSFDYDAASSAYRLKFLKDGQVTWVDVDARTGRIMRVAK